MSNFYFNNFNSKAEQGLIEDLVIESIRQYGLDNQYIPRTVINYSPEFREQSYSIYTQSLALEMYIKNVDGFEGEGEFLSNFGVQVREQITFSVAYKTFNKQVGKHLDKIRPLEGDLIWFGPRKALYTIKYVNMKPVFYQMGALQFYDIVCELFEYSNEIFNTGITEIDSIYNNNLIATNFTFEYLTEDNTQLLSENGNDLILEEYAIDIIDANAQNDLFEVQAAQILDFSFIDPFSENEKRA